jgi:hypothetical protein
MFKNKQILLLSLCLFAYWIYSTKYKTFNQFIYCKFLVINVDIYIYIYMLTFACIKPIAENLKCLSEICNINQNKSTCYFTWLLFYCTLFQSKNIQTHTATHIHYFYPKGYIQYLFQYSLRFLVSFIIKYEVKFEPRSDMLTENAICRYLLSVR